MDVIFKILRHNSVSSAPQNPPTATGWQSYQLSVEPSQTILSCLNRIKWEQDGSLTLRYNCRNTICGSCAIRINGRSRLACQENVGQILATMQSEAEDQPPEILVAPLGNLPVIKDLVVDMKPFWTGLKAIDPYISSESRQIPEREFLQTPEQRAQLNQTGNCIMCGACYSECNSVEVNPNFVGPHALAKAYRMVADNRDQTTQTRLQAYNQSDSGVWGCTRCNYCNEVCPMQVAPLDQISKIKGQILAQSPESLDHEQESRAVRHRRQMVELVRQGGWIDERKFGINVVGDQGRDLAGLVSLAPLGWRMLSKGKFPKDFHASEGTNEVRSLIDAVQQFEAKSISKAESNSEPE